MKQILSILILLCLFHLLSHAQAISRLNNPRSGDALDVNVIDVKSAGSAGQDRVWDFSNNDADNRQISIKYLECPEYPDCMMRVSCGTRLYERMSGDSLTYIGTESNTLKIELDKPETLAVYPMVYGDSILGSFYGRGKYCDKFGVRVVGEYLTKADATGTLILPDGNMLYNVIRLHTHRDFSVLFFATDSTWVSRKDYTEKDIRRLIQNDSTVVQTDIYRWYASGYRYPLLEYHTESLNGDIYSNLAYCFPVFDQSALLDVENEEMRAKVSDKQSPEKAAASGMLPYTFLFNKTNGVACVTADSAVPVDMEAVLASVEGITYQTFMKRKVKSATINFDCSNLPQGQYAAYIRIGSNRYTEKFSL